MDIYRIALSGLTAASERVSNDANNIANIYSSGRLPDRRGGPTDAYAPSRINTQSAPTGGVIVEKTPVTPAYKVGSDPYSPKANADGLVAIPNIDLATELVDLQVASVLYAANASVIKVQSENEIRLLDTLA